MKLSTYIMAGAFVAGLAIAATAALTSSSNGRPYVTPQILNGEAADKELPADFSSIYFQLPADFEIDRFEGIAVEMSDSVATPVLRAPEVWAKILTVDQNGGTLHITANPTLLLDSIAGCNGGSCRTYIYSQELWPITVVIPSTMKLDGVGSPTSSVQLHGIDAESMNVSTASRLVLYRCDIDTLRCSGTVSQLKVDQSTIEQAYISNAAADFSLNTCDGAGKVKSLSVEQ